MNLNADMELLTYLEGKVVLNEFQRWFRDMLRWHISNVHEGRVTPYPNKEEYDIHYASGG